MKIWIGKFDISPALGLAPMAGVTDKPFRLLCRRMGAGLATSEMTSANPQLRDTRKSAERLDHEGEPGPISVQIAGTEPDQMAEFARYNVSAAPRSSISTWAARPRRSARPGPALR